MVLFSETLSDILSKTGVIFLSLHYVLLYMKRLEIDSTFIKNTIGAEVLRILPKNSKFHVDENQNINVLIY